MWWDVVVRGCSASRPSSTCCRAATTSGTATRRRRRRRRLRRRVRAARARGVPAHVGLDHARSSSRAFLAYAFAGPWLPGQWAHRGYDVSSLIGLPVPDARRHLRHGGRRVVVADHPVHDLRRVPAAIRRRQVLPRLQLRRDGRQARPARAAPSCWRRSCSAGPSGSGVATTVTIGSVAWPMLAARRLRQGCRGRAARRGRAGRDHLAAGAGRGGVPDRRVPEDRLSRRAS